MFYVRLTKVGVRPIEVSERVTCLHVIAVQVRATEQSDSRTLRLHDRSATNVSSVKTTVVNRSWSVRHTSVLTLAMHNAGMLRCW